MAYFKKLSFGEWQQFQTVDIEFHERLTVLTGANGSGKTTIINNMLAKHSGWNTQQSATPAKDISTGLIRYFSRFFNGENRSTNKVIGVLSYNTGDGRLMVPDVDSAQYSISIEGQTNVESLFIPSHRPVYKYQPLTSIPAQKKKKQNAYAEFTNAYRNRYYATGNNATDITSFQIKNTLIGWAIQGAGNEFIQEDPEQVQYFRGFEEVLRKILPETIGFQKLEIRNMEIVFVCNDKRDEFVLEQASGGISALIDIAWQIYMFPSNSLGHGDTLTVMIDEIENHLHPTMQRRILPDLLRAFPQVRFIVSTHSPLIVASVKDSSVYALRYNENRKVYTEKLDLVGEALSANEILDEVLGVSTTMPIWAEEALERVVTEFSNEKVTKESLSRMRSSLENSGLGKFMPEATLEVVNKYDKTE